METEGGAQSFKLVPDDESVSKNTQPKSSMRKKIKLFFILMVVGILIGIMLTLIIWYYWGDNGFSFIGGMSPAEKYASEINKDLAIARSEL